MLTIQNYKNLEGATFWTNSDTQEWNIARIDETQYNYQIAVLPKDDDSGVFVLSKAIVYTLQRVSNMPDRYRMINTKNKREAWVTKSNLGFDNFILELLIQTTLNCNIRC